MAITVKQLNTEHPDYKAVKEDWTKVGLLYEGGHQIRKRCADFLVRRPRELQEVYQARMDRFSYHNILSDCFGWYHAAMFKVPPTISLDGGDEDFYNTFRKDCTNGATSFVDILRDLWTSMALYKVGYLLVDIPKPGSPVRSLRDQKSAGVLDDKGKPKPFLVRYDPLSVINWGCDAYGNFDWCVLTYSELRRREFSDTPKMVDVWFMFDRDQFVKYERERKPEEVDNGKLEENDPVTEVDSGRHALSSAKQVPMLRFEVPNDLWLGDRAYLPVLDHLNADNAYGWALFMANLAMPVIKSDQDIKPTLSESGFIQIPANAEYTWSEPEGRSFERSANRVKELREEIFRHMYLSYQGRTSNAVADGASGVSKEMDMMPAQDVMNAYGTKICDAAATILKAVAVARGEKDMEPDVRGMKFGRSSSMDDLARTETVLALRVPSETFEKEVFKQAAASYLPDMNEETVNQINKEIDEAPTIEEKEQAQAEQEAAKYKVKLGSVA